MSATTPARPPAGARRALAASALVLAFVLALVSCSGSDSGRPSVGVNGTLAPTSSGASCDDPKGDISADPNRAGSRTEPAGIDLLHVEATVDATTLKVTYTMAGPLANVPSPQFLLAQGPTAQTVSFEVRAAPGSDPIKPWALELVSWKVNTRGTEEQRRPLAETATVDGSTLHYEIPLKDLPPIATLIWQFGAQSGGDAGVFDDCSSFDATGGTLPPETTPGSAASTTTVPPAKLGEAQLHAGGVQITIFQVQDPPTKEKKLATPIDPDRRLALVDVQYCASPDRPATAHARQFGLTLANVIYPLYGPGQQADDVNYPPFPDTETLDPGKCRRGWVAFSLPKDIPITDAFYSENPSGDDAVVWELATTTTTPAGPSTATTTAR